MALAKKTEKRTYVSLNDFIRAYEDPRNETIGDVSEQLGIKPAAVSLRASKLKQRGVDLRKFSRGGGRRNIAEKANEILSMIRKGK